MKNTRFVILTGDPVKNFFLVYPPLPKTPFPFHKDDIVAHHAFEAIAIYSKHKCMTLQVTSSFFYVIHNPGTVDTNALFEARFVIILYSNSRILHRTPCKI